MNKFESTEEVAAMTNIIKSKGRAIKTIMKELKRMDFCTFDWNEEMTELDASDCFKGQVIRRAHIEFSANGRAITDLVIIDC